MKLAADRGGGQKCFGHRTNMDLEEKDYYRANRILLLAIGLWPNRSAKLKRVQSALAYFVLISCTLAQLAKFITAEYNLEIFLKILSTLFPCLATILKYTSFYCRQPQISSVMAQVLDDWKYLKEENEDLEIMRKYGGDGRRFTIIFSKLVYAGIAAFLLLQFVPDFLDIVMPLNESRPRQLPAMAEYFVDQNKYFYPILLHMFLMVLIGMTAILATESLFVAYLQHACGLFKLAGYRLEHALDEIPDRSRVLIEHARMYSRINSAIKVHNRAIEFTKQLWSTFATSYILLISIGVVSLSVNLFRLFQALEVIEEIEEVIACILFISGHFVGTLMGCYYGQRLIDHSTGVYYKTYNAPWYKASLHVQKLYLLILQRSIKNSTLGVAGIFTISFEKYTTLVSTSFSYFTVIYSML